MRTVIVTGGCGFIGGHFVQRLFQQGGWRVVNLDLLSYAADPDRVDAVADEQRYRFVRADIGDDEAVRRIFVEESPDAVVNFAAETHVDRSILDSRPFVRSNVDGVRALLEACRACDVDRFVQISTDEVYGDAEGEERFDEGASLQPSSPYAATKAAADLLCGAYRRTYDMDVAMVRPANNYGPFQFPEKLIPVMIRNALRDEELPVYGDGRQRREWLHVADCCEAIVAILESPDASGAYNVSPESSVTNLQLVGLLCDLVAEREGRDPESLRARIRLVEDRPGHDRRYATSSRRLRTELGWSPSTELEEGLGETVDWYLRHPEWLEDRTGSDFESYYSAVYEQRWTG